MHGGVYCSIVESVASVSAARLAGQHGGGNVVGVNNNTDFLRAIRSGTVTAVSDAHPPRRRQQLWLIAITDDERQDGRPRSGAAAEPAADAERLS